MSYIRFLCLEFAVYSYGYLLKIGQKNYLKKDMETNFANSKRKFQGKQIVHI